MQSNIIIDRDMLLSYLGYKGQSINALLNEKIEKMTELCYKIVRLKNIYKEFEIGNDYILKDTLFYLEGNSIKEHLKGCKNVILLAATCGQDLDMEIQKLFITDKTSALILDTCGSVAIESYLDNICKDFKNATERFSCGYGDFPLSANKAICQILKADKMIGLNVNSSYLLSPKKSVTALIGLGVVKKPPLCDHKCQLCTLKECLYNKK